MVAWSQPYGFAARQEVQSARLGWADGEHLSLTLNYVWEPYQAARRAKVEEVKAALPRACYSVGGSALRERLAEAIGAGGPAAGRASRGRGEEAP